MLMGGSENKLFFLAPKIGPENANISDTPSRGYTVRWDLYKQLGYPEINSDDDYIKVLQDMVNLYPATEEGLPVYAMGGIDNFQWWYQRGSFIRETGSANFWTFNGYQYCASYENMELLNGYMDPNHSAWWTDMVFFNKLWNLGLMDPDSFTMTMAERDEKTKAKQYVGFQQRVNTLYNETVISDPNTDIGYVMIPSSNAVMAGNKLCPAGGMPTDSHFIFANSPNWEAAAEVLNFFHDPEVVRVMWNGKQGVSWDYDSSGKPFLTEKGVKDRIESPLGSETNRKASGIYSSIWDFTPLHSTCLHEDGYFMDIAQEFEYRAMVLNPISREVAAYYGVDTPSRYYQSLIDSGYTIDQWNDFGQVVALGINEIPADIQRIMNNLNDLAYRAVPRLVTAATQAEYDAIQQEVLASFIAADEATAWEWCLNAYNDAKALTEPVFREAQQSYLQRKGG
jgi:hypothetical protein